MKEALKILMLEDSIFDAEIIQQVVLRAKPGCIFKLVMNKEDFLDGLDQFNADLILSDNTLPQFNATEALELFQQRDLPIPFILVTGTVSEEFAAGIIKSGADDYILKDRLTRLPAAIDAALQKKKTEAAIHQSEETRRLIMNASLDAIVCIDKAGLITVWNAQAEKMFGWKETEVIGKNLVNFIIPEQYRAAHINGFSRYNITGEGRVLNKVMELSAVDHSGKEFPVELAIVHVEQNTSDFFCAFIRDVTERKKTEDKIKFNADLLSTVGQAVIATDTAGAVIYWNHAAEKIYGWTVEEAVGKQITGLVPTKQSREEAMAIMAELSKGNFWSGEFSVQRKDGTAFPAFVTTSPVHDSKGNLTAIIGVSADMSEMKKTEETFKEMERKMLNQKIQEQKKISRAIIKAQEEEKNYIGKELHDNISQILASTKMFLSSAAKKNESIREIIKYPIELINSSIDEIRLLSHKQVTPLKNINLEEMLQNLVTALDTNSALNFNFNYSVKNGALSDDLKLNIYRIVQEQMNNIVKHAHANNITIEVKTEGNTISVHVTDDGKGFKLSEKRKGIGISNMTNRIESYNGKMQIRTSPGNGTTIKVTIPVSEAKI